MITVKCHDEWDKDFPPGIRIIVKDDEQHFIVQIPYDSLDRDRKGCEELMLWHIQETCRREKLAKDMQETMANIARRPPAMFNEQRAMGMALTQCHGIKGRYRVTKRFSYIICFIAGFLAGLLIISMFRWMGFYTPLKDKFGERAGQVRIRAAEIVDRPLVTSEYWQAVVYGDERR